MGYDAFGLPAEQYAIQTGQHPSVTTEANIATFRRQMQAIGLGYDWDREFATCTPDYYRWTQWIFARLSDRGLVSQTEVPVWWCEELKTVLANEEVINGRSERGDHPCVRRPLKQWMLRITAYADRLIDDLEDLDWPESVKTMQREWIGRSEGAEVRFPVEGHDVSVEVFTTRPDTLYGVTFMVLAPEHPLVDVITSPEQRAAVDAYREQAAVKSELDRTDLAKEKTGVATGAYALNPLLDPSDPDARIPVHVGDYVLMGYGTGAVMCVPGHDEQDHEYTLEYGLPIRTVVAPADGDGGRGLLHGVGVAVASPRWGLDTEAAKARSMEARGGARVWKRQVTYRLRDWLFDRQRYWGEPFRSTGRVAPRSGTRTSPVSARDDRLRAAGRRPPLSRATDWVSVEGSSTERGLMQDTDTMPGGPGRAGTTCASWTLRNGERSPPRGSGLLAERGPLRRGDGARGPAPPVRASGTRCFTTRAWSPRRSRSSSSSTRGCCRPSPTKTPLGAWFPAMRSTPTPSSRCIARVGPCSSRWWRR